MKNGKNDAQLGEGGGGARKRNVAKLPYGTIGRALLGTVAVAGALAVGLAAPGIFQAVKILEKQYRKDYQRYRVPSYARKVVQGLVDKKLIRVFERDGEMMMRLTEKGERELMRYKLREKSVKKWHWDKKWRLIIFDIAEKKRQKRDNVRKSMQSFGFVKLQDSVWVYPYECEQVIDLLKAEYQLGKELLYVVAGEIENDEWLKKKFDLK